MTFEQRSNIKSNLRGEERSVSRRYKLTNIREKFRHVSSDVAGDELQMEKIQLQLQRWRIHFVKYIHPYKQNMKEKTDHKTTNNSIFFSFDTTHLSKRSSDNNSEWSSC